MRTETERHDRKLRDGVVVSSKMDKTVVVKVERKFVHKKYGKVLVRASKCYAHDETGLVREGDKVVIMETRPLSKLKRWRVVNKLAEGSHDSTGNAT
jgi:small subunit ribosomal protein S17